MPTMLGWVVLVVFVGTYLVISTEKINRTGTSLLGMAIIGFVLMIAYQTSGGLEGAQFAELAEHIEWDTILFVTAMMIIVAVATASGLFQYLALTIAVTCQGDHRRLYITLIAFVFVASLFLDTVSTMLIMAPLTIQICKVLEIDFKPYLVSESIVCNFASIPSIVGAVPNLVIASETKLNPGLLFLAFMPLSIILILVSFPILLKIYGKNFSVSDKYHVETLCQIDPRTMINSRQDFYESVIAFAILIIGFAFGPIFGLPPPMIALLVAAFLLILSHDRATEFLSEVGWETVFFLIGLFGLVVALELTGLIEELGVGIEALIAGNDIVATVFMVWIPAMLSAFLDNLPVFAVLAPIAIRPEFASLGPILPLALVFAVNVGGYIFTPLGSPANMIAIAYSEREHDHIPFSEFAKIGTILGIIHLTIGSLWLLMLGLLV